MNTSRNPLDLRKRKILSITLWGTLLNALLMILKIFAGLAVRSTALVADGFHSLSDLATDFVVLASARVSNRPADESHPYGHGRFETLATQAIAVILLIVGFGLIWEAGTAIYEQDARYPGFPLLIVASISVITKEILFKLTRKVSHETNSPTLYANAWHHRSDALSSVAVLAGGIAALFGWGYADHAAAIVVGIMIIAVASKILYNGLIELTEQRADSRSVRMIKEALDSEDDISEWHALRTRRLGGEVFFDVHICVESCLSVLESHEITVRIEEKVKQKISKPVNILIHVEPRDYAESRSGSD